MLITEFNLLTGFYPSAELYRVIEHEYVEGPWKDKQEFCEAYKANKDGLAERLAMDAHEAVVDEADKLVEKIRHFEAADRANSRLIRELREKLDREQEWALVDDPDEYSDEDYDKLYDAHGTDYLSEKQAAEIVAREFGFRQDLVDILPIKMEQYINRHGAIREGAPISRAPLYNATDWNYIRFEVRAIVYEMQNSELRQVGTR